MRFEPQVPNTMTLKVVREEAEEENHIVPGEPIICAWRRFFLLTKWDFARTSSPEFSLGKARSWSEGERKYGDMSLEFEMWTKVVIVNQAFVQRKHQKFKLIHLAAMERKFSRSRKFILSRRRKWDQVGQKPWSNLPQLCLFHAWTGEKTK